MPMTAHGRYYEAGNPSSLAAAQLAHYSFEGAEARRRREKRAETKPRWWNRKRRAQQDASDLQIERDGLELLGLAIDVLRARQDEGRA